MNKVLTRYSAGLMALLLVGTGSAWALEQPPTFTKDVLPIFQQHCQTCHRPAGANLSGMIAPMPLMTYAETRPWAKSVAKAVMGRTMPPWHAAPQHSGAFKNERVLTDQQIATIVDWVKSGAPMGEPGDAPAPIEWPDSGWTIGGGQPDLVVGFDEPNWVADEVDDLYQNITITLTEEQLPEDRWLKAIEFKPGSEAVHHIIAYQAVPDESGAMTGGMLGGEAPGTDPAVFPDGYGILLAKGAHITFQMHYHKESGPATGVWDSSTMALEFHDEPVTHALSVTAISNGAFEVPPGHPHWKVGGAQTFGREMTVLGFVPHLHLRGIACRYTAYYPDGTSKVLLDVPRYDFNWQTFYQYKDTQLVTLPAGTRVEFEMWYDNSLERAAAVGYNGARPVAFGGPTWDEMDLGFIHVANAKPLDMTAVESKTMTTTNGD